MIKTIILCGGKGYRLKEETEFKPKPMVLIGGKPILWHIMKIYSHYGFNDFVIALGYKGDYIKDYFLNQKYLSHDFTLYTKSGKTKIHKNSNSKILDDFKITFVDTGEETLPGERILKLKNFITEDNFMVTYGDGVGNLDIEKLIKFHKKQRTIGTITGVNPESKYGWMKINNKNIVNKFAEKPVLLDRVNGGFMVFKKRFFDFLKPGETEHPALSRLAEKSQLSVYLHNGSWYAMDTYRDVDNLNKIWQTSPKWKIWSG